MIAIDFFCGAGGLTRGLLDAGIEVVLGVDSDESCRETYEANNAPSQFLAADIRKLRIQDIRKVIRGVKREDLLFAACAPCQPFANLNRSEERDEAATLLGQFARFVEAIRPGQIFIENVPGLAKVRGSSTHKRFRKMLENLGYGYCEDVLDAKAYGVPQTRRRFIMIAIRGGHPTFPPATHGPGLLPYKTVEDAIRGYPAIKAGESNPEIPNHRAAILSPINLDRIQNTPHDGGDRHAWPRRLWLECHSNGHEGHDDVYGRMRWKQPSPALTCRCHSISNGRYGHPIQDRAISLREAAKLQSFDDTYVFHAITLRGMAAHIGNAVPVKLAEVMGRYIKELK